MIHFKDSKTKSVFREVADFLTGEKQYNFIREVKKIADHKIVSDSVDFTVTMKDLDRALVKVI